MTLSWGAVADAVAHLIVIFWIYWLVARVQLLLTYGEQLLSAGKQVIASLPSKSADRTDGPADDVLVQPWFPRLRLLADLRDLADDLGSRPDVGPDTTVADAMEAEPDTEEMDLGDELAADAHAHLVHTDQPQPTPAGRHRAPDSNGDHQS